MNPANWFLSLLRQLLVDYLFKRPITMNLTRNADGAFDLKTNISPSGQTIQSQQQYPYYGGYPPYGYPPGWPVAPPPLGYAQPNQPTTPPVPGHAPTPTPMDNFPEEYDA